MRKGSITIFFALILSMIIVLICASMESVKMMCARTQIANGADVGMYSLFAQYDRYLLDTYGLFYVDASYGTDDLQMSRAYRTVERYMMPILEQDHLDLSIASGGITSFVLATDQTGQPFRDQAVTYMRDAFGSQGVHFLVDKIRGDAAEIRRQEETGWMLEAQDLMARYDEEMARAGNESAQAEIVRQGEALAETPGNPVVDPIDMIREIWGMGILDLVIADQALLSDREIDTGQLVSQRSLEEGMGALTPASVPDTAGEKVLFQEYMMQNCGTYCNPSEAGGLRYQVEYSLGRTGSDRENLERVASRLLAIRESDNFALLCADPQKRAQSAALAADIASGSLIPPSVEAVEMALLCCWSFAESILDVKALFDGGRVPLVKDPGSWDLPLERLPDLLAECAVERPQGGKGLDYEDYLRALLFLGSEEDNVMGCMDMIEADVRGQRGREGFRMDCCLEAMEVGVDVGVGREKIHTVIHRYGYDL